MARPSCLKFQDKANVAAVPRKTPPERRRKEGYPPFLISFAFSQRRPDLFNLIHYFTCWGHFLLLSLNWNQVNKELLMACTNLKDHKEREHKNVKVVQWKSEKPWWSGVSCHLVGCSLLKLLFFNILFIHYSLFKDIVILVVSYPCVRIWQRF